MAGRTRKPRPPAPVADLSGSQLGETGITAAGGDIITNNEGADAGDVLSFLREHVFRSDQVRETAIKEATQEIRGMRSDLGIVTGAVNSLRERVNDLADGRADDQAERLKRQAELDRELRVLRYWLAGLTIALAAAAIVVGWLIVDRYAAAALVRIWLGAGAALALALRGRSP